MLSCSDGRRCSFNYVVFIVLRGYKQFVDCCGCNLEEANYELAGDFLSSLGWQAGKHLIARPADRLQELEKKKNAKGSVYADTILANLASAPHIPAVLLWERKVTARVPNSYPAAGTWLLDRVGYHFPLLGKLRHGRTIKALCTVLRDNMDPRECNVSPCTKALMGIIFAVNAKNKTLAEDMKRCASHSGPHLLPQTCDIVSRFALEDIDFIAPSITLSDTVLREAGADLTLADRRVLLLAKAGSTSPSTIGPVVLGGMETMFSPSALIEMLVWLGVCQMLHRFYAFYDLAPEGGLSLEASTIDPKEDNFYMNRGQDDVLVSDDVRAASTLDGECRTAQGSENATQMTKENYLKGSIARADGGRLVLRGAEPIFLDESLVDSTILTNPAGAATDNDQKYSNSTSAQGLSDALVPRVPAALIQVTPHVGDVLRPRPRRPVLRPSSRVAPMSRPQKSPPTSGKSPSDSKGVATPPSPADSLPAGSPRSWPPHRQSAYGPPFWVEGDEDVGNTVNESFPSEGQESQKFGDRPKIECARSDRPRASAGSKKQFVKVRASGEGFPSSS